MVWSSPAIAADGTVYVGSLDHKVYALDGKTGTKKWGKRTGSYIERSAAGIWSSPTIGEDGTVCVGSEDGRIYALKTNNGGLAKSPWPMRGQNPQHTGRAPK